MSDYFICPHCGADVAKGSLACPECGSDETTGWSMEAIYQGLGLGYDDDGEDDSAPRPLPRLLLGAVALLALSAILAAGNSWGIYLVPLIWLAVSVAYFIGRRGNERGGVQEKELRRQLLIRARGDGELVQRLIDFERMRSPDLDDVDLLQDALERWQRDAR